MELKSLSIIIVNYNNYELTNECINSVLNTVKNLEYEIIVVDNNSPNDSYDKIYEKFGEVENVTVIKSKENAGFGAGNNLGAEKAIGEYLLFLNPDILVIDNAIEKMLNTIKDNQDIGLLSGKFSSKLFYL